MLRLFKSLYFRLIHPNKVAEILGAGSIVRGELKSNSVYAGVPVKYICSIDEYKNKNKNKFIKTYFMDSIEKEQFIKNKFSTGVR